MIGMRGTGKSTLAPLIARQLGDAWQAVDLDEQITIAAGETIATVFANEGEAGFRQRECAALAAVADADKQVVATGGGVILLPENRQRLQAGYVVLIIADLACLAERIDRSITSRQNRPALTTAHDRLGELMTLWQQRESLYRAAADLVVASDGADGPASLARRIVRAFHGGASR